MPIILGQFLIVCWCRSIYNAFWYRGKLGKYNREMVGHFIKYYFTRNREDDTPTSVSAWEINEVGTETDMWNICPQIDPNRM